jgi:SAM-dependent methyltransferase
MTCASKIKEKGPVKRAAIDAINGILTPLRLLLPHDFLERIGIRSIRDDRNYMALRYVKGRVLDIGCGLNLLVKRYGGEGVGVDIYDVGGGATIIQDAARLPFPDDSFDTVTFVGSFNHIPDREAALHEVSRVLRKNGRVIVTMPSPFIGILRHMMFWVDSLEVMRLKEEHKKAPVEGLSHEYLTGIFSKCGYTLKFKRKFSLFLNNLYIFERNE